MFKKELLQHKKITGSKDMNSIIQMDSEINQAVLGFSISTIEIVLNSQLVDWWLENWVHGDCRSKNHTPIVIVGGAFQNFNSYK